MRLLCFPYIVVCNKLSTYDYIVQSRQRQASKDVNSDVESTGEPDLPPKALNPLTVGIHIYSKVIYG